MISLSYKGTLKLLDRINKDYDCHPMSWKDSLVDRVKVLVKSSVCIHVYHDKNLGLPI